MTTPSIQALDAAVKPAGFASYETFCRAGHVLSYADLIALAYAAHLDKADKQNREVLALLADAKAFNTSSWLERAIAILRANLLPEPIDPDLLEARKEFVMPVQQQIYLQGIRRGRELAKEQDRG